MIAYKLNPSAHLFALFVLLSGGSCLTYAQDLNVVNPSVDHLLHADLGVVNGYVAVGHEEHIGERTVIGNRKPLFGWELQSEQTGIMQSAYRVVVSRSKDSLLKGIGEIWDSGKVVSNASVNVQYAGNPLESATGYLWRVKIWDAAGNSSRWSDISKFTTADSLVSYSTSVYPLQKVDEVATKMEKVGDEIRLDFSKASFGQLRMTLESREVNDTIIVRLGERRHADGRIDRHPGGTIRYAAYQIPLKRGRHTYILQYVPDQRNTGVQAVKMPSYIGEVLPFRYCEIEGYKGELSRYDIVRSTVHYPFDDGASSFESSDSVLNAVWDICKYTIKATTYTGIYVDGDRERIAYEGDVYINQLGHYSVDREYSIARRSHEYLIHNATWPTEWILQSVLIAYNDYLYTGDIRSAKFYYDDLKAKLLLPLRESNGLISTRTGKQNETLMKAVHYHHGKALRDLVDWPHPSEIDGFVFTDYNAVVNAYHYKALCDMVLIANELGFHEDALQFADYANETFQAFQDLLWDNERLVYQDGVDTDHASLHTNMMAVAFGLVPEKYIEDVVEFIQSRGMSCSVYGSQFLLDALYETGHAKYALALLTSKSDRSWYNMIRAGSTMTMEAWDDKYKGNQDWNHPWGAVPANVIPRKLMGIEPLSPGFETFSVRPQLASLDWAKINVPTIRGAIYLACEQTESNYIVELTVPGNSTAFVELPTLGKRRCELRINGELVRFRRRGGVINLPPLEAGTYSITVSYIR
ncbi:alpha-L-rhamnosidase C-terminal domain-containing protein [Parapedobacter sp. 10938]|uniref:alpha-L-rhamnosidase-related protein n=1 Tax=Parapedobacter flavus TaxID=3110225 RepID=UPI002DBD296C|nr:alpha-L-rhamnosidase C-terminal domain-containing protein [Parapedobacter sp. 10938]MEC3878463.1 alpha-L-rhamnosidase C-terminal domain-containing protein [Parapedobacter sp. 10938]